ncbi:MAG: hypothetical protein SXA11_24345 [Cyanobacteriota bacterium]|nr:hypothetical protein [Cyanobacteriota bacterium]
MTVFSDRQEQLSKVRSNRFSDVYVRSNRFSDVYVRSNRFSDLKELLVAIAKSHCYKQKSQITFNKASLNSAAVLK